MGVSQAVNPRTQSLYLTTDRTTTGWVFQIEKKINLSIMEIKTLIEKLT